MSQSKQLWGGRFQQPLSEAALRFSSSIDLDKQLYRDDITGSIAHVEMLAACRILTAEEARRIRTGLKSIAKEIDLGKLSLSWEKEDIHMAIEQRLIQKIGPLGGKLHTARSRNDQIALDERLFLRNAVTDIKKLLVHFQRVLLYKSEKYFGVVMPGYTHLQRAQPIYLSHQLLAYISMFERDYERLSDAHKRINRLPLGSAALAGTSFAIDRAMVARKLKFEGIIENSIDAVSDRDYVIEFTSICSTIMMHLSRMAEELVLWSTSEFAFVRIDDAYTTGSSIMPQKKNPDMAELVRGKTGRVYGDLMNILTTMKALPLAYNRDMQEDKTPLFDAVETTRQSVFIMTHVLIHSIFMKDRFTEELKNDTLTATEIADYLVQKNVPFRDAHEITGKMVRYCADHHKPLVSLTIRELHHFSHKFSEDVLDLLDPNKSIDHKRSTGSTAPNEVKKQIVHWTKILKGRK
ncbi:MAG: argininosuccinate lyase [Bacteroidota bacterium]|jgi:argininosuccinate lyase